MAKRTAPGDTVVRPPSSKRTRRGMTAATASSRNQHHRRRVVLPYVPWADVAINTSASSFTGGEVAEGGTTRDDTDAGAVECKSYSRRAKTPEPVAADDSGA